MSIQRFSICFFATLAILLLGHQVVVAQETSPVLDIRGTQVRALIIAVPEPKLAEPAPSSAWQQDFDTRLRQAIAFHGALAPLDRDTELDDPSPFGRFRPDIWRTAGAEMLLSTLLRQEESGLSADVHLFEIGAGEAILSKRYRIRDPKAEDLADAIAGEIVELLLGIRSPFAQPLAFQYRAPGAKWRELYTGDWTGNNIQQRTNDQKLVLHPSFIPDSSQLIAIGYRERQPSLRFFDLAKGTQRVLLDSQSTMHGPMAFHDGRRVAFAWERNQNTDVYILDLASGKWERMTTSTAADLSPTVSPDGNKIAFISDRRGNPYIYLLDVETKAVEPFIMDGAYLGEPEWSPDGKHIVYVRRERNTGFSLWVYDVAGKQSTRLTEDLGNSLESPAWGPDSRTIIYSTRTGATYDIWKVDRLLKQPKQLTRLPGDARMPTWRAF